jgi:hypothetical protein
LDLIVGAGDHGQKACKAAAFTIVCGKQLKKEMPFGIGSIGCVKDTAGLLNASLALRLNKGWNWITQYVQNNIEEINGDGFL